MPSLEQAQPPYIFYIPAPRNLRVIGLFLLAVFVLPLPIICLKIGLGWILSNLAPALFLITVNAGAILYALWVLFPPQSTLARFEFACDRVRYIPNFVARSIGEQSEEAAISPRTAEILICHYFVPQGISTYRISVRAADGMERELASHFPHALVDLKASEIDSIVEKMAAATSLTVRAVNRRKLPTGAIEDTPWTPSSTKGKPLKTAALATLALPYIGGILVGLFTLNPTIVITVGLALWLCMVLAMFLTSRGDRDPKSFPLLKALTTLVSFSAAYALCFVVTAHFRGRL
jgi:hypothetical protein